MPRKIRAPRNRNVLDAIATSQTRQTRTPTQTKYTISWEDPNEPYEWPENIDSDIYHANNICEYIMKSMYSMVDECIERIFLINNKRSQIDSVEYDKGNIEIMFNTKTEAAVCCSFIYYTRNHINHYYIFAWLFSAWLFGFGMCFNE